MAARKQPLRVVSYSGLDPELVLDDQQFEILEAAYGRSIVPIARQSLLLVCNEFLLQKRIEKLRQTWRDVEDQITPYRNAASAMWKIAYELPRGSDAFHEFERILDPILSHQMLRFDAKNELFCVSPENADAGIIPFADDYQLPDRSYFMRLSDALIQQIAMALSVAVNIAQKKISEEAENAGNDTSPMEPIAVLILSVTRWAKLHDLPFASASTREGYDPAPFSKFMAKLLSLMPEPYRENNYATDGGIEAKIKRVRAAHRKRMIEQNN